MKENHPYKTLIICMFFLLPFLGGCWDVKDIDKRLLPLVIGIAKENGDYQVTLQIPITQKENEVSRIVTGKAETVLKVLGQVRTNSEEAVDYSHIELIIIQSNLAANQQEMRELIEFLMHSEEIPSRALVAITDDKIDKVLSNINDKLGVNATSIYNYFNKGAGWAPEITSVHIWEVYRSLYSYTKDMIIPVVRAGNDTVLVYEGSSVLKNGELMAKINPDESQLTKLFQNFNAKGKVESFDLASMMVINSAIKNKASLKNGIPTVTSHLTLKIAILERKKDVSNEQITKELTKLIEKRFYDMLEQGQANQTDLFGFGQLFRQQLSYQELKSWRKDFYPRLKVDFQVHVGVD
ncbi:Ger(x)C family spore germination protein [Lysinibacillus sp. FSL K6-0075]|uniref:Ger(x)C family spore germination protein n=1 Tax=Lysinibacillus sp. FSL K6-0075 TaxID=2921415 RepID=UPI003158C8FD